MRVHTLLYALALLVAVPVGSVQAQPIDQQRVQFQPGTSGAVINGQIQGTRIIDYKLGVSAGQRMVVELQTSNPSNYFNVTAPGASAATFNGSVEGNRFDGVLPSGGDWTIRVYLMRNAARRAETANFTLTTEVGGSTAQPAPDFADGNAGGPDFWQVTGVSNRLNMRSGPSTSTGVVDTLAANSIVRNLGCRGLGNDRWCEVERPSGNGSRGWVAGRFLRESGAPTSQPSAPAATTGGNDTSLAEQACKQALADTANKSLSDIVVFDVLSAEAGIAVMMTLAGAEKPWSCTSDSAGNVQGLMYTGEG